MRGKKKAKCCEPSTAPTAAAIDTSATVQTNRSVTVTFPRSKYQGYGAYVDCNHVLSVKEARELRSRLTEAIMNAEREL